MNCCDKSIGVCDVEEAGGNEFLSQAPHGEASAGCRGAIRIPCRPNLCGGSLNDRYAAGGAHEFAQSATDIGRSTTLRAHGLAHHCLDRAVAHFESQR